MLSLGEAVEARIKSFNEQTKPVLAAYSQTIDVVSDMQTYLISELLILFFLSISNIPTQVKGDQAVESVHRDMSLVIDTFYAEISATITLPYVA